MLKFTLFPTSRGVGRVCSWLLLSVISLLTACSDESAPPERVNAVRYALYTEPEPALDQLSQPDYQGLAPYMTAQLAGAHSFSAISYEGYFFNSQRRQVQVRWRAPAEARLSLNGKTLRNKQVISLDKGQQRLQFAHLAPAQQSPVVELLYLETGKTVTLSQGQLYLPLSELTASSAMAPVPNTAGWHYRYVEQAGLSFADLTQLPAIESGNISTLQLSERNRADGYGFVFSSYFSAEQDTLVTLRLNNTMPVRLWLNDQLLLENPASQLTAQLASAYINAGQHKLQLEVLGQHASDTIGLQLAFADGRQGALAWQNIDQLTLRSETASLPVVTPTEPSDPLETGFNVQLFLPPPLLSSQLNQTAANTTVMPNYALRVSQLSELSSVALTPPYRVQIDSMLQVQQAGTYVLYWHYSEPVELQLSAITAAVSAQGQLALVLQPGLHPFRLSYPVNALPVSMPTLFIAPPGQPRQPMNTFAWLSPILDIITDRDGDGVPDHEDAFPDDPSRWQLPDPEPEPIADIALQAAVSAEQISLSWPAYSHSRLQRLELWRSHDSAPLQKLADITPAQQQGYSDSAVANGGYYQYQLRAFSGDNQLLAQSAVAAQWLTYNNATLAGFSLSNADQQVTLSWQAPAVGQVVLQRQQDTQAWQQLSDNAQSGYQDSGLSRLGQYQYRASVRRLFSHPLTGETLSVDGPVSAALALQIPAALQLQLSLPASAQPNSYSVSVNADQTSLLVSGQVSAALGPVQLVWQQQAQVINQTVSNGSFSTELPLTGENAQWQLYASSTLGNQSQRSALITLQLVIAESEPVGDIALQAAVSAEQISLSWPAYSHSRLQRLELWRSHDSAPLQKLADITPAQQQGYSDSAVANGGYYQYQLRAFSGDNQLLAQSAVAAQWLTYNNATLAGFSLSNADQQVTLSWQAPAVGQVVLQRQQDTQAWQQLSDNAQSGYQDSGLSRLGQYQYRASVRRLFSHPLTGETLSVDGPVSAALALQIPAALQLQLSLPASAQPNSYSVSVNADQTSLLVSGQVSAALGPVQLVWQQQAQVINQTVSNDSFSTELPLTGENAQWQLYASSTLGNQSQRSALITLQLVVAESEPVGDIALQAAVSAEQISLSWPAYSHSRLQRLELWRSHDSAPLQKLADITPAQQQGYSDSAVANGGYYQYQLRAFSGDNQLLAQSAVAAQWLTYNNATLAGFSLSNADQQVTLSWQAPAVGQVVLQRQQDTQAWQQLSDNAQSGYQDSGLSRLGQYQYRASVRRLFSHPLTGETLSVDGPVSAALALQIPAALQLQLSLPASAQPNSYSVSVNADQTSLLVSGQVSAALGPVQLVWQQQAQVINQTVSNGSFSTELPLTGENAQWQLYASSTLGNQSQRSAALQLDLLADKFAPVILLDQDYFGTDSERFVLSGQLEDASQPLRLVLRSLSPLQPDLQLLLDENNRFSTEVLLTQVQHDVQLVATDAVGRRTEQLIQLVRQPAMAPEIQINSHRDGETLTQRDVIIQGYLYSRSSENTLTLQPGNITATLEALTEGKYRFSFAPLSLQPGDNLLHLQASSSSGVGQKGLKLLYQPLAEVTAPVISVSSPLDGSWLNNRQFNLAGEVSSQVQPSFDIDGSAVALVSIGDNRYRYSKTLLLPAGQSQASWQLSASNEAGTDSQSVQYRFDATPPQIQLFGGLVPAPEVNQLVSNALSLSGQVSDQQPVTLTVDGAPVLLQPADQSGHYRFDISLPLRVAQTRDVEFAARDMAGNISRITYRFENTSAASIELIAPAVDASFITDTNQLALQLVARVQHQASAPRVMLRVNDAAAQQLPLVGNLINTTVPLTGISGPQRLWLGLYDDSNQLTAQTEGRFSVTALTDVPLTVVQHEPLHLAEHIERNAAIALFFNKALDPALLSVDVRQTLNGKSYVNTAEPGAMLTEQAGETLQPVNLNNEPVAGGVSVLPGNHSFAFYPQQPLAYGADVRVTVRYDGAELKRFSYRVRALPTLVDGALADAFGEELPGIRVALNPLGRQEVSGDGGIFSFGYLDSGEQNIPSGSYRLEINPGMENPAFSNLIRHISLNEGNRHDLGQFRLLPVNKDVAFNNLASGQSKVVAANGDVELNLSAARVDFGQGRSSGTVQVSLVPFEAVSAKVRGNLAPLWAYATLPQGITVSGDSAVRLKAPRLYGGYDYLPNEQEYMVLLGRAASSDELETVGVVRRQGNWLVSEGPVALQQLDYLSVGRVHFMLQPKMAAYAKGELALVQLQAALMATN